jgi:hypothetical protein
MTATLEQVKTQEMSVIFPTEPPHVHIHILPRNSEHITYRVSDDLRISAWMPEGLHNISQRRQESYDGFFSRCCRGCHRNCYEFLNDHTDEDGEIDWDIIDGGYNGHCFVYDNGYDGQSCPEGEDLETYDFNLTIPNMVFEIALTHIGKEHPKFSKTTDSAYLCAGKYEDGVFYSTDTFSASNVFGGDDEPENICWGYNRRPTTLREIASQYFSTPFNDDILSLDGFEENCSYLRSRISTDSFDVNRYDTYLCNGSDADALILVDAENNVPAFFTLLSAGFKSLPKAPHIMMVPIREAVINRGGNTYEGYQTIADSVGKQWFVTKDGFLVGQI